LLVPTETLQDGAIPPYNEQERESFIQAGARHHILCGHAVAVDGALGKD